VEGKRNCEPGRAEKAPTRSSEQRYQPMKLGGRVVGSAEQQSMSMEG
jgi:hypothetical protein